MTLVYRSVKGSPLTSAEGDGNISDLDGRLVAVEAFVADPDVPTIDHFSTTSDNAQFYVHLTDSTVLGPYSLPESGWNVRLDVNDGDWAPSTFYYKNDAFRESGALYRVRVNHTSDLTFDPDEEEGTGEPRYELLVPTLPLALDDLTDVTITTPAAKQTVRYSGTGWVNEALALDDLSDVVISSAADGDFVFRVGGTFVNTQLSADVVPFVPSTDNNLSATDVQGAIDELSLSVPDVSAYAPLASPVFTGNPTAPTPSPGDNDTSIATTAFVAASYAPLASPALTGTPTAPTASPGDNDTSIATTAFVTAAIAAGPTSLTIAASDEGTALTTGTAKVTFRMPYAMTLTAVRGSLSTAQSSGSILTVDVNEGGTTILSTKLTIDNSEKTSTTAATAAVISDASLADDAEITIDIDQVGDGTAKGLKVTLIGTRT